MMKLKKRLLAILLALTLTVPAAGASAAGSEQVTQPFMTWLFNDYQTEYYRPLSGTLMLVYNWAGYYGIIDWQTGEVVLPMEYVTWAQVSDTYAMATTGDKWGGEPTYHLINTTTGTNEGEGWPADDMSEYYADRDLIPIEENGKYGYFSPSGAVLVPPIYDDLSVVGDKGQYFLAEKDGLCGVFDRTGTVIFPFLFPNVWYAEDTGHIFATYGSYLGVAEEADYLAWSKYAGQTVEMGPAAGNETVPSIANTVILNGKEHTLWAYLFVDEYGGGTNYVKLRDVAALMDGTSAQFEVEWNQELLSIYLTRGEGYTEVGGELVPKDGSRRPFVYSYSSLYCDGVPYTRTAYTIDSNNYFKLRDLADLFDFYVEWDQERGAIVIYTF